MVASSLAVCSANYLPGSRFPHAHRINELLTARQRPERVGAIRSARLSHLVSPSLCSSTSAWLANFLFRPNLAFPSSPHSPLLSFSLSHPVLLSNRSPSPRRPSCNLAAAPEDNRTTISPQTPLQPRPQHPLPSRQLRIKSYTSRGPRQERPYHPRLPRTRPTFRPSGAIRIVHISPPALSRHFPFFAPSFSSRHFSPSTSSTLPREEKQTNTTATAIAGGFCHSCF